MESKNKSSRSPEFSGAAIPPQDTDIEEAVLGALLLEQDTYYETAQILSPDVFYDERHRIIYAAIKHLAARNEPIDMLTVVNRLRQDGRLNEIGGAAAISLLTQKVASGMSAVYHASILYQLYVLRQMISGLSGVVQACYAEDFDVAVHAYQTTMSDIDRLFAGAGGDKHISSILRRHGELTDTRIRRAADNRLQGITYGLHDLDRLTGGAQGGQLIILAARPAMGKTALALKFAKSAALDDKHVAVASLEMRDLSLIDRLLSSYAEIDGDRLRSGRMSSVDMATYNNAVGKLSKLNIYIDDTAGTTIGRLRAMARAKHRKGELDMLIIDYLQLIESEGDAGKFKNREREVAEISRQLKKLAKELNIPVILLCQLNRAAESRTDKQPQLYDLRESGSIEQDADVVMMPFRPAYYAGSGTTFMDNNDQLIPDDMGMLFVRKQRDGNTGVVKFKYSKDLSEITDYITDDVDSALF